MLAISYLQRLSKRLYQSDVPLLRAADVIHMENCSSMAGSKNPSSSAWQCWENIILHAQEIRTVRSNPAATPAAGALLYPCKRPTLSRVRCCRWGICRLRCDHVQPQTPGWPLSRWNTSGAKAESCFFTGKHDHKKVKAFYQGTAPATSQLNHAGLTC